jgi:hypothetical protein
MHNYQCPPSNLNPKLNPKRETPCTTDIKHAAHAPDNCQSVKYYHLCKLLTKLIKLTKARFCQCPPSNRQCPSSNRLAEEAWGG